MKLEVWKPIKDFPDYEISNFGNVKSKERYLKYQEKGKYNSGGRYVKEKLLKPYKNNIGYLKITLKQNDTFKVVPVHRMVAKTFITNFENKPQVNHIDGNKKNNNVSNLEWATSSENVKHSYEKLGRIGWDGKKGKRPFEANVYTLGDE